jgi:hypothetical protein
MQLHAWVHTVLPSVVVAAVAHVCYCDVNAHIVLNCGVRTMLIVLHHVLYMHACLSMYAHIHIDIFVVIFLII